MWRSNHQVPRSVFDRIAEEGVEHGWKKSDKGQDYHKSVWYRVPKYPGVILSNFVSLTQSKSRRCYLSATSIIGHSIESILEDVGINAEALEKALSESPEKVDQTTKGGEGSSYHVLGLVVSSIHGKETKKLVEDVIDSKPYFKDYMRIHLHQGRLFKGQQILTVPNKILVVGAETKNFRSAKIDVSPKFREETIEALDKQIMIELIASRDNMPLNSHTGSDGFNGMEAVIFEDDRYSIEERKVIIEELGLPIKDLDVVIDDEGREACKKRIADGAFDKIWLPIEGAEESQPEAKVTSRDLPLSIQDRLELLSSDLLDLSVEAKLMIDQHVTESTSLTLSEDAQNEMESLKAKLVAAEATVSSQNGTIADLKSTNANWMREAKENDIEAKRYSSELQNLRVDSKREQENALELASQDHERAMATVNGKLEVSQRKEAKLRTFLAEFDENDLLTKVESQRVELEESNLMIDLLEDQDQEAQNQVVSLHRKIDWYRKSQPELSVKEQTEYVETDYVLELPDSVTSILGVVNFCKENMNNIEFSRGIEGTFSDLDKHEKVKTWIPRIFNTLASLDQYAAANAESPMSMNEFLTSSASYYPLQPYRVAIESATNKKPESYSRVRTFSLPHGLVDGDSAPFYSHVRIDRISPAPRVHFYDDSRGESAKIYIGYIGAHLPTGNDS